MVTTKDLHHCQAASSIGTRGRWRRPMGSVMLAFALASCGGGGSDDSATSPEATAPELARVLSWVDVTGTSVQALSNTGYMADSAEQVTITLPAAPAAGDVVAINGVGTGGWKVAQNEGQSIVVENLPIPWTPHETVRNWNAVASSANGESLVALSDDGHVSVSNDAGKSWKVTSVSPGANVYLNDLASWSGGQGLVVTGRERDEETRTWVHYVYTSSNGGQTWPGRYKIDAQFSSLAASKEGEILVAGSISGQVYTSVNQGETWDLHQVTDADQNWYAVASSESGRVLVAAANDGQIYTSVNHGDTWVGNPATDGKNWYAVASSAEGDKLVAVEFDGQIYTSDNYGATWTAHQQDRRWNSVASSADGNKLGAAVGGGHIYTSSDAGHTWIEHESERNWRDVASSADGSKLTAVANASRIYSSGPARSTLGTAGSLSGGQYDTIELQYLGEGVFYVPKHSNGMTSGFAVQ